MEIQIISISDFRTHLGRLFREVCSGKKTLIVSSYDVPLFTVAQCGDDYECKYQFTTREVRNWIADFQDKFLTEKSILLARRGKKILCTRI